MLVVMIGEPFVCCLVAVSLLARYGPRIQILIVEDLFLKQSRSWTTGPLPWCVTNIRLLKKREFLSTASYHQSRSSVMFLDSVHRAHHPRSMEMPVSDKVCVRPSPDISGLIMYHPKMLEKFLKTILKSERSCFFVQRSDKKPLHEIIQQHSHGRIPLIFNLTTNSHNRLPTFALYRTEWIGLNNWSLRDKLLLLSHPSQTQVFKSNNSSYNIVTSSMNYDLGGLLNISDCITKLVDSSVYDGLRFSKL